LLSRISEPVTIVRQGPQGETRTRVSGSIQTDKAIFPIDTDIEEGDRIEKSLPNGKTKTYRATRVTYNNPRGTPQHMHHVSVQIEPFATRQVTATRRVELSGLHPDISAAAGALFVDGHYSRAVFAAFQAIEHAVQQKTSLSESGVSLMHRAFNAKSPLIDVARRGGRNAADEREGFQFLFAGAMTGLRNPRGHGQDLPDTDQEALEYLALASALMRRIQ
jgi:uncharacterized protein (TIGR02391 family)